MVAGVQAQPRSRVHARLDRSLEHPLARTALRGPGLRHESILPYLGGVPDVDLGLNCETRDTPLQSGVARGESPDAAWRRSA